MVPVGLTSRVACRPCWGPWFFWEPVQFCSGLVTQMAERSMLSPGSAGPNLHDDRFGMETWHTGSQEVTAAKKNVLGVKEQLGKRLRGSLQHFQSYRRLSSLTPCAGAFKTILREVMARSCVFLSVITFLLLKWRIQRAKIHFLPHRPCDLNSGWETRRSLVDRQKTAAPSPAP